MKLDHTGRSGHRMLRLLLGALAATIALSGCSVYDVPLPGGADVGSNPLTLHLRFRDVLDLVPQSTVKVDDVTVGKVTSIKLDGYIADVTVEVPGTMQIPDNEQATIDQTSLLGEKFINLKRPANPSGQFLADNATIPLSQTGRNPEVEEVLGALAALLNGGGVGQIKSIASELNTAVGGREQDVRAVLDQIHTFMGVLDANKAKVVGALDHVDRLAKSLRAQDGTVKQTLADLPGALRSVNTQRADLRRLLSALSRLSNVGVKVIKASKESTINTLSELAPVLTAFANAGQALPKSLQVILTFPFIDAAVGSSPEVARNLHIGDFVDLNAQLDLDLTTLSKGIGLPVQTLTDISTLVCGNLPASAQSMCAGLKQLTGSLCSIPGVSTSPLCNNGSVAPPNQTSRTGKTKKSTVAGPPVGALADDSNAVNQVKTLLGNLFGPLSTQPSRGSSPPPADPGATSSTAPSGLAGLLAGFGLGRPAPEYDRHEAHEALSRLRGLAGAGRLLLQGVYS